MTDTTKHTPEPWSHGQEGPNHWIRAADRYVAFIGGNDTIFTSTPGTPHDANANRIVACVNGCKDLNPEGYQVCVNVLTKIVEGSENTMQDPRDIIITEAARAALEAAKKVSP